MPRALRVGVRLLLVCLSVLFVVPPAHSSEVSRIWIGLTENRVVVKTALHESSRKI